MLLSYENEAILARQNGEDVRLHRPRHDPADREPGRGHRATPTRRPRRSWTSCSAPTGQKIFASNGFRPLDGVDHGDVEGANDPATRSRRRRTLLTIDETSAAGTRPTTKFFDEDERASSPVIQQETGKRRRVDARRRTARRRPAGTAPDGAARRPGPSARRLTPGARARRRHDVVQPARADPAGRRRRRGVERRMGRRSGDTVTNAADAAAALRLTVDAGAAASPLLNVVMGTLIAWVLVRDQFPGKRVLDVVIDIPFALPTIVAGLVLLSLYGPQSPLGVDVANTRPAVFLALAVRHPAVRRAHRAAGARRARPRRRGGRGVARRQPVHDLPPDHAAEPGPGDRRGRGAVVRPGDQRVRLARAALRQPADQDRGRLGAHPDATSRTTTRPRPRPSRRSCWSSRSSCIVALDILQRRVGPPWLASSDACPRRWRRRPCADAGEPARSSPDRADTLLRLDRRRLPVLLVAWPVGLVVKHTFADGVGRRSGTRSTDPDVAHALRRSRSQRRGLRRRASTRSSASAMSLLLVRYRLPGQAGAQRAASTCRWRSRRSSSASP